MHYWKYACKICMEVVCYGTNASGKTGTDSKVDLKVATLDTQMKLMF